MRMRLHKRMATAKTRYVHLLVPTYASAHACVCVRVCAAKASIQDNTNGLSLNVIYLHMPSPSCSALPSLPDPPSFVSACPPGTNAYLCEHSFTPQPAVTSAWLHDFYSIPANTHGTSCCMLYSELLLLLLLELVRGQVYGH
jgi:hypothetical protein